MLVKIENYQSIASVEFEPTGFTIIVGESNIGKSSIMRSLVGALSNSLDADAIRRTKKECLVSIQKGPFHCVVERNEKTTSYEVGGKPWEKLARQPCPAVEEAGFRTVKIGDVVLTPQWNSDQFSPLFILDKSPSVAAGMVTQATRLDVISRASKNGASELRQSRLLLKTREVDKKNTDERLELYHDVPALLTASSELSKQFTLLEAQEERCRTLTQCRDTQDFLLAEAQALSLLSEVSIPPLPEDRMVRLNSLIQLRDHLKFLRKEATVLSELGKFSITDPALLEGQSQKLEVLRSIRESLASNSRDLVHLEKQITEQLSIEHKLNQEETTLKAELKVCPVCGQEFKLCSNS